MSGDQLPSADLMEALMKDPVKKKMLLQLILQNKEGFDEYKRRELKAKTTTPLKKVKKIHYDSPTTQQRKRALEKFNQNSTTSEESSSDLSVEPNGPQLPTDKLLEGVIAYVEVKRNNIDRSEGIKAVMKLMGATIRDEFTKDVTHVIFKDGSFTTYQKAKLMRVHFVSVLWLDAVRRTGTRVLEKKYPAFGSQNCDSVNASVLCSQLQKDYEEIVKDEKRKTLHNTSSKLTPKNKRHTIMVPSTSSFLTSRISPQTLFSEDEDEVELNKQHEEDHNQFSSDDSNCGVIDGEVRRRAKNSSNMEQTSSNFTDDLSDDSSLRRNVSRISSFLESSGSTSLLTRIRNKERTVNVTSDMVLTPNTSTTNSNNNNRSNGVLQNLNLQNNENSARASLNSDRTKSGLDKAIEDSSRTVSNLGTTKNTDIRSCSTMSSLRLSDSVNKENDKKAKSAKVQQEKNQSASMSKRTSLPRNLNKSLTEKSTTSMPSSRSAVENSKSKISEGSDFSNSESETELKTKANFKKGSSIKSNSKCSVENVDRRSNSSKNEVQQPKSVEKRRTRVTQSKQKKMTELESSGDKKSKSRRSKSASKSESSKEDNDRNNSISKSGPSPVKKIRMEKKTRKLYNPDEVTISPAHSDIERAELMEKKLKKNQVPQKTLKNAANVNTKNNDELNKTLNNSQETDEENREFLDLLTKKLNDRPSRRSQRLTPSQSKPKYVFSSESQTGSSELLSPMKRRSTLDFQSVSQPKRKLPSNTRRYSSIVCTKLHRPQVLHFERAVKKLGKFFVEDMVSDKTTHLVAGETARTLNMLRALARGCWIVSHEWLLKSEEEGKWLEEEDYELTEFSPAVQKCRLQRQAFGAKYRMDVFKECGFIYVAQATTPKQKDLQELITICQGRVTTIYRNAAIVVGELIKGEDVTCVKEAWILDSITFNKLKPFKNYRIKSEGVPDSPHF